MLGIDRYSGEGFWIGGEIRVHVKHVGDRKVRLLVDAPKDLLILRDELNGKRLPKQEPPESLEAKRAKRRRKRRNAATRKGQQAAPKPNAGQAPLGPRVFRRERESVQLSLANQFAVREGMDAERQAVNLLRGRECDDAA